MQNPPCLVLIRSSDVTKAEANVAALEVLWLRDLMPFYIASYNTCHIWFLCERRKFFVGPAYNRFAYFADVSTGTSGDIRATTDFNEGLVLNHAYLLYVTNYIYTEREVCFLFCKTHFLSLMTRACILWFFAAGGGRVADWERTLRTRDSTQKPSVRCDIKHLLS